MVLVATCNRVEVYVELFNADDGGSILAARMRETLVEEFARATSLDVHVVRAAFRVRTDDDVVRHLFAVGCGLDSMIVGEREVAGQVRRALERARGQGTTSSGLEHLFQRASRVSRDVEAATGLGASGRSIVDVALGRAAQVRADAGAAAIARALVLGTGSYAGATLAALRARGISDIGVFSRSGRARPFAAQRAASSVGVGELFEALTYADVVIACSGTSGELIDTDLVERVLTSRRAAGIAGPLPILDLALRRDVASDVGRLPDVVLLDLRSIQEHAPAVALEPVVRAWDLVARAVRAFTADTADRERRALRYLTV